MAVPRVYATTSRLDRLNVSIIDFGPSEFRLRDATSGRISVARVSWRCHLSYQLPHITSNALMLRHILGMADGSTWLKWQGLKALSASEISSKTSFDTRRHPFSTSNHVPRITLDSVSFLRRTIFPNLIVFRRTTSSRSLHRWTNPSNTPPPSLPARTGTNRHHVQPATFSRYAGRVPGQSM